jgi:hypothetical protein
MPDDNLSRSFIELSAISVLDMKWAHEQEKDNISNLIKESLNKNGYINSPCQIGSRKQNSSQIWPI